MFIENIFVRHVPMCPVHHRFFYDDARHILTLSIYLRWRRRVVETSTHTQLGMAARVHGQLCMCHIHEFYQNE